MTQVYAKTINITNETYQNNADIISVDLNNCYMNNMDKSFYNCANLTDVYNLNSDGTSMHQAFENCYNLIDVNITIPNSVTSMYRTFWYCNNLVNVPEIPNSVIQMDGAFQHDYKVIVNSIPNSVTDMFMTFQHCYRVNQDMIIPNSVVNMVGTFSGNVDWTRVPDISNCTNLKNIRGIFSNDRNIISAPNIPSSVVNINTSFERCTNLTGDIIIYSNQISDATECFNNTSLTKNVYIPFTYQNGDNTLTYNSFINAGYGTDPTNRVNGVCLFDVDELYAIDDSKYTFTNNNGTFYLENYIGTETSIKLPRSK